MSRESLSLADALGRLVADNPDLSPSNSPTTECDDAVTTKTWPRLDIEYQRKGRGGKPATIISGFGKDISDDEIADLAAILKKRLATGGSARGGEILLQGDRRQQALEILKSMSIKSRII